MQEFYLNHLLQWKITKIVAKQNFIFFAECTVTQFECSCGKIRCVDGEKLKDGKNDCEDGSDEVGPSTETLCANGSPVRQSRVKNRTALYPTYSAIAQCPDPLVCNDQLGEMCIVSNFS